MQRFSGFLMTIALGLSLCVTATPVPAENIRIGILKVASMTPLFVAQDRGYFRDESLSPEIIFFDQPTQIAPGVVSGDLDFALTGFGGALFNLAGQGGLRVIGGTVRETPGFPANATSVSNGAYDKGLRSFKDLGGHATAVDNAGSILTYATWALAQKNGSGLRQSKIAARRQHSEPDKRNYRR
jgi:NitT/TauT family transport system substrate-binding protein